MLLSKLSIPFDIVVDGANLILVDIVPYYEYQDGKRTDNLQGYKFVVVEDKSYEKFAVKIPSIVPAITKEQMVASKEKIRVSFKNAIAKPYKTYSGEYELSVTATGINIEK